MLVGLYSWVIVIDHLKQQTSLVIRDHCPQETQDAIQAALAQGSGKTSGHFQLNGDFTSNFTREEYQLSLIHI